MSDWYAKFFKEDASRIVEWLNKCVRDTRCGLAVAGPVEGFEAAADEIDQLRAELAKAKARIAELEDHAVLATLAKNNDELRARIAELETYHTNCTDHINQLLGNIADDDKERVAILARAEGAEAERDAMRERYKLFEDGNRPVAYHRDTLGRYVREAWVRWARTQANPKPSWLVEYDDLPEPDKEADRQIGECIARWTIIGDAARAALAPSPAGREEK